MNIKELSDKIEWEGGTFEAITSYGLIAEDLDTDDPELRAHWVAVVAAVEHAEHVAGAFDREMFDALYGTSSE